MKKGEVKLTSLVVHNLIAHDIPKCRKSEQKEEIELSEATSPLPSETLDFFSTRLKGTLSRKGQMVVPDPLQEAPPLPPKIDEWLDAASHDVVDVSHSAARHLYVVQPGSSSAGLLAVCAATISDKPALALMKLPHEAGLSIEQVEVNGKKTIKISVLGNLTLTEHTRVFKAGVFWRENGETYGLVSDDQAGEPSDVADFFLSSFLGYKLRDAPKTITRNFRDSVTEYINSNIEDEAEKVECYAALNVELRSNSKRIAVDDFISKHLGPDHQDALRTHLQKNGVPNSFRKDLSLIPNRGNKGTLRTVGGLSISGESEALEKVSPKIVDNEHILLIRDKLKSVG